MNTWLSFLSEHNGHLSGDHRISFGEEPAQYQALAEQATFSPLLDRGVLSVNGADTDKLLQGQLTCDMKQLAVGGSLPGALCDNKGRMISTFVALRPQEHRVLLVMHADLVAPTLDTLKKYAVFYKTRLEDLSADHRFFGINHARDVDASILCGTLSEQLALATVAAPDAVRVWESLAKTHIPTGTGFWQYLLIRDGLGEVRLGTQGEFIPQMLNLQHTGAVNFRKGCYTGQEIVARMQYLGKLKRRMYRLSADTATAIQVGAAVHHEGKSDVGTVVLAEFTSATTQTILAVLTTEAAQASHLTFNETEAAVHLLPLPYDDKFANSTSTRG